MVKILAQAGTSLADVYNVQGSIAGIDQLESAELGIIHEMGGTVLSERLAGRLFRTDTGDILQTITWEIIFSGLAEFIGKISGASIWTDDVSRVANASLSLVDDTVLATPRNIPIFAWDSVGGASVRTQIADEAAVATFDLLIPPVTGMLPNLIVSGTGQPRTVERVAFRGLSTTFGAGTVNVACAIHILSPGFGGLNSRGLPLPSW